MKTQTLILRVNYEEDEKKPNLWCWNDLIGCEDCIELINYSEEVKFKENEK